MINELLTALEKQIKESVDKIATEAIDRIVHERIQELEKFKKYTFTGKL